MLTYLFSTIGNLNQLLRRQLKFPNRLADPFENNVAIPDQKSAWQVFEQWDKSFLCCFSDGDPVTRGGEFSTASRSARLPDGGAPG